MKQFKPLIVLLFISITGYSQDCNLNEDSKRHWYKAEALRKMAEKEKDYYDVVSEYKEAAKYAPDCPDIYYNLALCQEILCKTDTKSCDDAISNFRQYLKLNPYASDNEEVQIKIYGIEAQKMKFEKEIKAEKEKAKEDIERFVGVWKNSKGEEIDIYIENGKLKTKVIKYKVSDVDGIGKYDQEEYKIIDVIVNKDCIMYEYVSGEILMRGKKKLVTHDYRYVRNLCLVSSNLLECDCFYHLGWVVHGYGGYDSKNVTEKIYYQKQ